MVNYFGITMDKITQSLLKDFSSQFDLEKCKEDVQFEHFSNYSIISKLHRSPFELEDIHVGSGGDCAIDGICLVVNGKIITDSDELDTIVEQVGYLDADITFIQSKTTSSFSGSDIGSFIHGVKDFLSEESNLVQNKKIQQAKQLWNSVVNKSPSMVNRSPNCKLFYVCTGKWVSDKNLLAIINNGQKEIEHSNLFSEVLVLPNGAQEIQRLYQETKNKLDSQILFRNRITLPEINGVQESYLGVIPFQEFIKLIQDENQTIHSIFDDNVRDFQGENIVNTQIKKTLADKKFDLFCLLNNGITVVASALTALGDRFTLRDYQIVNGCQTSNVLHECQKLEGIEAVSVPIRIIVTEDENIKTEITRATNSQTEVKIEQLEALSAFQKQLELYYAAEKGSIRLYYERRTRQYNSLTSIKRIQIITIPVQIKSFASMFLESPHLVSGYYGTIVKRFKGEIFAQDHKYLPYFVSSLCYYRVEQFFRNGELSAEFKKARFHLMMIVKMLVILPPDGNTLKMNSNELEKQCEKFKSKLLNDTEAIKLFQLAVEILKTSGIDLEKPRYKSSDDTDTLRKAVNSYVSSKK